MTVIVSDDVVFVLERGGYGPGGCGRCLLDAAFDGVSDWRGGPGEHAAAVRPAAGPAQPAHGPPGARTCARPRARAGARPDEAVIIPQVSPTVSGQRGRDRVTVLCHRQFIELATQTKLLLTARILAVSNNVSIVSELLSYTLVPTTYLISVVKMAIYITLTCYM